MPGTQTTDKNNYGFATDYAEYDALVAANDAKKKPVNQK